MSADKLKITLLGCGTSVGVPCLGRAGWGYVILMSRKNRRQRCALLVVRNHKCAGGCRAGYPQPAFAAGSVQTGRGASYPHPF